MARGDRNNKKYDEIMKKKDIEFFMMRHYRSHLGIRKPKDDIERIKLITFDMTQLVLSARNTKRILYYLPLPFKLTSLLRHHRLRTRRDFEWMNHRQKYSTERG
jgi:hypothetical protein